MDDGFSWSLVVSVQFSGPVSVFHDRRLPEAAAPVGYAALIDAYKLPVPINSQARELLAHAPIGNAIAASAAPPGSNMEESIWPFAPTSPSRVQRPKPQHGRLLPGSRPATTNAEMLNRQFAADVIWGSPYGALIDGYERLHPIHVRFQQQPRRGPAFRYQVRHVLVVREDVAIAHIARLARTRRRAAAAGLGSQSAFLRDGHVCAGAPRRAMVAGGRTKHPNEAWRGGSGLDCTDGLEGRDTCPALVRYFKRS
ncbi:MAG: hypothetical protein JO366_15360 [Methylobacteriaceae bacterium]|nr:hypothetical protein [Methylobacteriaceae bacterium]